MAITRRIFLRALEAHPMPVLEVQASRLFDDNGEFVTGRILWSDRFSSYSPAARLQSRYSVKVLSLENSGEEVILFAARKREYSSAMIEIIRDIDRKAGSLSDRLD